MADFRIVRAAVTDYLHSLPPSATAPPVAPFPDSGRIDEFWDRESAAFRQRARRAELARECAKALLLSLLRDDERQRYDDGDGALIVTGSHGGRYLIEYGYQGNVHRLDGNDYALTCYCAHPPMILDYAEMLPIEGAMISQILAIRYDEAAFLGIANVM